MNPEGGYYAEPHHCRMVRVENGRPIGFVRLTRGGHWQAYSYPECGGCSPFDTEDDAVAWVRERESAYAEVRTARRALLGGGR